MSDRVSDQDTCQTECRIRTRDGLFCFGIILIDRLSVFMFELLVVIKTLDFFSMLEAVKSKAYKNAIMHNVSEEKHLFQNH